VTPGQSGRNEIDAQLANRHLIGCWKNSSDNRYFGVLHLAVLPGEAVMEGHYSGYESDVEVSKGPGSGSGSTRPRCPTMPWPG
jgi:hypothetical protein